MFIWDPYKAISNFEKHAVSFTEATSVFEDELALEWEDYQHSLAEQRYKRLGLSASSRILLVVYTFRRSSYGKKNIRIISARQASRRERKAYSRF